MMFPQHEALKNRLPQSESAGSWFGTRSDSSTSANSISLVLEDLAKCAVRMWYSSIDTVLLRTRTTQEPLKTVRADYRAMRKALAAARTKGWCRSRNSSRKMCLARRSTNRGRSSVACRCRQKGNGRRRCSMWSALLVTSAVKSFYPQQSPSSGAQPSPQQ